MAFALLSAACAQDIKPIAEVSEEVNERTEDGLVYCEDTSNCVIDASDYDQWVYLDLESGLISQVPVDPDAPEILDAEEAAVALREAEEKLNWDLAFQRFKVKTNGGISGSGGMEGARISGADYDAMAQAPSVVYTEDAEDSDDFDQDPDTVFLGDPPWFDYDVSDHSLSPADAVYVVKSVEGNYFKIAFLNYYTEAGTSGYPAFKWAPIEALDPNAPVEVVEERDESEGETTGEGGEGQGRTLDPGYISLDTTDDTLTHYINLNAMNLVTVDEASASLDWDIAVRGTTIITNSAPHGEGVAGAQEVEGATWDSQTHAPTVGYLGDDESGNPVLNQWASADGDAPREVLFLLRSAAGEYAKFQVTDFSEGTMTLRMEMLNRAPMVHTTTLDASEGPVYFDFLLGLSVTPDNPAESDAWDFAIHGAALMTNGGSSGTGEGAAGVTEMATLEEVLAVADGQGCYVFNVHKCDCDMSYAACEAEGEIWTEQCPCDSSFLVDDESAGPEEGQSANPALSEWHEGDPELSPAPKVFVLRTRHSGYVKFLITGHEGGVFTLDWLFSGPGQDIF